MQLFSRGFWRMGTLERGEATPVSVMEMARGGLPPMRECQ